MQDTVALNKNGARVLSIGSKLKSSTCLVLILELGIREVQHHSHGTILILQRSHTVVRQIFKV